MANVNRPYEVHEHCFVSGPRANRPGYSFDHSHPGGSVPHQHPNTGPACFTIDRDEWRRRTGRDGGGRKVFTKTPTGERLPVLELEPWQKSFDVIIDEESLQRFRAERPHAEGPGEAPAMRMVLGFRMKANVRRAPRRRR